MYSFVSISESSWDVSYYSLQRTTKNSLFRVAVFRFLDRRSTHWTSGGGKRSPTGGYVRTGKNLSRGGGGGAPSKNVLNFRYFRWYLLTVFCIILRILCARIQLSSTVCLTPLQNILLTKHSPPPPSGATLALTTAIGSESYSHMTYKELCNSVRQNHHNSRLLCHKPTTLEYISH